MKKVIKNIFVVRFMKHIVCYNVDTEIEAQKIQDTIRRMKNEWKYQNERNGKIGRDEHRTDRWYGYDGHGIGCRELPMFGLYYGGGCRRFAALSWHHCLCTFASLILDFLQKVCYNTHIFFHDVEAIIWQENRIKN